MLRECVCIYKWIVRRKLPDKGRRICKPTFLSLLMEPLRRVKWAQLFMECGIGSISLVGAHFWFGCSEARRKDLKHSQRVINLRWTREERTHISLDLVFGRFSIWSATTTAALLFSSKQYIIWFWFCYGLWALLENWRALSPYHKLWKCSEGA